MNSYFWRLATVAFMGLAGLVAVGAARADDVPLDKLPKAIVQTLKKRFPDAEMTKAVKEGDKDKTVYEVSLKRKGHNIDVNLSPDGQIQQIEQEIGFTDLPKVIADAINAKYAKAKFKTIEQVIHVKDGKESLDLYEFLLVTPANETFEVYVSPAGKITSETKK